MVAVCGVEVPVLLLKVRIIDLSSTASPVFSKLKWNLIVESKTPAFSASPGMIKPWIVPIPGTKRVRYLEENALATDIELSDEEVAGLHAAFPVGATSGTRYADMSTVHK